MTNENAHFYGLIMAGGGGTRLWPLSVKSKPKQLIPLTEDRSLFQIAVDRAAATIPAERMYVVASADLAEQLHLQCPQIPRENFVIEPSARGNAAAIMLAARVIALRDPSPEACMAVLTADHVIKQIDLFNRLLSACRKVAVRSGNLVTIGIQPTYPATGFGYLELGEAQPSADGFEVHKLKQFKEKPDLATATAMLKQGGFVWNSGMFVWTLPAIQSAFDTYLPATAAVGKLLTDASGEYPQAFLDAWKNIERQTIDYGIMEKAPNVSAIPAGDLGWFDVGSWNSLFDIMPADMLGNIVMRGEHLGVDSSNNLVYSDQPQRIIATIGMNDLVIVEHGKSILICKREDSEKVKAVIDRLKEQEREEYL